MRKLQTRVNKRLKVTYFQRRPRAGLSFSLEHMFSDMRSRLGNRIEADIKISKYYNDGILAKVYNIFEAALRQSKGINHVTGEVHFLNLLMRKETLILTILDCGMMHRKRGVFRSLLGLLYFKWPVRRASLITSISEQTKREVIKYTNCRPDKIYVVPVAVDTIFQPFPKRFNASKPRILHIGAGYNKNLMRLAEALTGLNCELRIIGRLDQNQIRAIDSFSISYTHASDLSRVEMLEEYKSCDILAFISTFEGFGMPIIEANSVERVAITSKVSSMPEVAGNAAHLVDPYSTADIRDGILELIANREYRERLIKNGRRNKLRFDPDKIADSYFELYRKFS